MSEEFLIGERLSDLEKTVEDLLVGIKDMKEEALLFHRVLGRIKKAIPHVDFED